MLVVKNSRTASALRARWLRVLSIEWQRSDLLPLIAIVWLMIVGVGAIATNWLLLPNAFDGDLLQMLAPPSAEHWFGSDSLGRDMFARCLLGARVSLSVGVGSVLFGLIVGGTLGLVAGYFANCWGRVVMASMTVLLSFPPLILAIVIVSTFGANSRNVALAIGVLFVPAFARMARANTLLYRQREFVLAAEAMGASTARILFLEILPNIIPALLAYSVVMLGVAILAESSLGFLGLSVPPPMPSWGGIIAAEKASLRDAPWAVFFPALMMFLSVAAVNVLGERARKMFDVKAQGL
ncbi:ABC transporter permease [Noviherbaspirillum pedocola]|uniref:ABC transporter permease n=1 Tax=Noviherbaspirillum pedocola TaxID=2801341 RepID=A0A934WA75_9BURK|nr:ABC transporter permease [Noviherbaspirillum pedocola]MBK4739318.1 ABC transporter permease [Noviherbaspirillum pedocola]